MGHLQSQILHFGTKILRQKDLPIIFRQQKI